MHEATNDHVVMVAEDNAVISMMLVDDLQEAGYAVAGPFSHSAAALAWLQGFSPDVAVLDVLLKDGSCVPVVRELRARRIPFMVFSGHSVAPDMPDLHGVPWIVKPSSSDHITNTLAMLLSNSISATDARACLGRRPTVHTDHYPSKVGEPRCAESQIASLWRRRVSRKAAAGGQLKG